MISQSELNLILKINFTLQGHGEFGWVVTGYLLNYGKITVKILKDEATPEELDQFKKNEDSWATVIHPNVVTVLGTCFSSFPMMSILEWSDEICAKTFLISRQSEPDLSMSVQLAIDVCSGLASLHDHRIVVPDLAVR